MRLDNERPSDNVQDQRGRGGGGFGFPGGGGGGKVGHASSGLARTLGGTEPRGKAPRSFFRANEGNLARCFQLTHCQNDRRHGCFCFFCFDFATCGSFLTQGLRHAL